MNRVVRHPAFLGGAAVTVLGIIASDSALLPGILFWAALLQGMFALVAAAEVAEGRWLVPAREIILDLHPFMLILPVAFLAFSKNITVYSWTEHPSVWLNPAFFIIRNVAVFILTWYLAWRFTGAVKAGSPRVGRLAVWYILVFVLSQSLLAFDLVMSFEFPWISTLLGGYFFIEALFGGIALTAIISLSLVKREPALKERVLRDSSTFLFGFSLLWAGQFFAQYLVIWYGNIPAEQEFLVTRLTEPPLSIVAVCVILFMFFIPFTSLLSKRAKTSASAMIPITGLIFTGILLERLLFLIPVTTLNPVVSMLAFMAIGIPVIMGIRGGLSPAPGEVRTSP